MLIVWRETPFALTSNPSPASHLIFTSLTILQISKRLTRISKIRCSKLLQKSATLSRRLKSTSSFFSLSLALLSLPLLPYFGASCSNFRPPRFQAMSHIFPVPRPPSLSPHCSSTHHYHTADLVTALGWFLKPWSRLRKIESVSV